MKRTIIPALLLLMAACSAPKTEQQVSTAEETAKTVKVATIKIDTVPILASYTATINAYDKVYMAPNIPGRIKKVNVEVNDKVKKGDVIVEMDDTQLKQLEVQYVNLQKEMERMDALIEYGSVTQQLYDQTKAQYEATKANYENLKENTRLVSPFNGVITDKFFENNEIYSAAPNTQAGKAAIVTLEQINKLKITINVSERYFPKIKNGLEAELVSEIYPNQAFVGKVSLIYPTIDPATRTFKVEITIENDDQLLRPGMFARINLNLGTKSAIMIPASTVMSTTGTNERFVFVVNNLAAKRVKVTIGDRINDLLEISSPDIKPGDQLVTSGQTKLESGDKIQIVK